MYKSDFTSGIWVWGVGMNYAAAKKLYWNYDSISLIHNRREYGVSLIPWKDYLASSNQARLSSEFYLSLRKIGK